MNSASGSGLRKVAGPPAMTSGYRTAAARRSAADSGTWAAASMSRTCR